MGKAVRITVADDMPRPITKRGGRPMKYPLMAELQLLQSLLLEGLDDLELRRLRSIASQMKGRRFTIARLDDGRVQVYRVE